MSTWCWWTEEEEKFNRFLGGIFQWPRFAVLPLRIEGVFARIIIFGRKGRLGKWKLTLATKAATEKKIALDQGVVVLRRSHILPENGGGGGECVKLEFTILPLHLRRWAHFVSNFCQIRDEKWSFFPPSPIREIVRSFLSEGSSVAF